MGELLLQAGVQIRWQAVNAVWWPATHSPPIWPYGLNLDRGQCQHKCRAWRIAFKRLLQFLGCWHVWLQALLFRQSVQACG